jgi:hypothetical protein
MRVLVVGTLGNLFLLLKHSDSIELSDSPANKVSGLTSVNTALFDPTSLNSAVNSNIPNLVADLTTLKSTIDAANTAAAVTDLTFTGAPGAADETTGLNEYKAKLTTISTDIANLISLLNNDIKSGASDLVTRVNTIKYMCDTSKVYIFSLIY